MTKFRLNGKKIIAVIAVLAVFVSSMAMLVACKDDNNNNDNSGGGKYNNDTDALVLSTQELDKVFNPFFSTSATDSNIVGMTQISMLSNTSDGKVAYGDNEAVVVKDLETITEGEGESQTTTYYFVLKNNVRFSNGTYLTIKDVLFNMYVYLDPVYTGSATMYSTDIVGLKTYRTQAVDETEQENFKAKFEARADARVQDLISACTALLDEHKYDGAIDTDEALRTYLAQYAEENKTEGTESYLLADYNKALELFKEELNNDYSNSVDTYKDIKFTDANNNIHEGLLTTDVEAFLYNEGFIKWNKKANGGNGELTSDFGDLTQIKSWTKDYAISLVYKAKVPQSIVEILEYWGTATTLREYLTNLIMEEHFQKYGSQYKSISGIQFANMEEPVTVNGTTYNVPEYADGTKNQVVSGNEVLKVVINKVDPKAIWNFAFAVAPMYYYSDAEHINAFDYKENFGVEYGSQTFMTNVVKNPNKIGVPVGAGPYVASKSSGGTDNVSSGDFYDKGMVYFEANPYYIMGAPLIKKVQYRVVSSTQVLNALYTKEIDFAEPNAKPETIRELNSKKSEGFGNKSVRTSGYGYIGINAGKVPDVNVRRVIMHCINTQECVDYYETTAKAIYRSMSMSNWAYPSGCTSYYPYIGGPVPEDLSVVYSGYADFVTEKGYSAGQKLSEADQTEYLLSLLDGYTENANGVLTKGNNTLKYTFTIAGEEKDHPAYAAMKHASEILNKLGFQINVTTDANALKKLATGDLTVWAAAWSSTIDPDMYQVYHKDSTATSVLNWGYKQIKANVGGKYDYEVGVIDDLSDYIEQGRETTDINERKGIYAKALDLVMELAIELPTYQRDDLYAYNTDKIDVSTFTPDSELSPYKGLMSDLHKVSLNVER